jgi:hypothetical protein
MTQYMIVFIFLFLISVETIYLPNFFDNINAQSDINPSCVVRGESVPPPPFIILKWNSSGICDSTIDHFVHFYDIRAILNNNTDFILFLESN